MTTHVPQVGGDHYQAPYQHWDWAHETGIGWLEGNATKYISRWRKKGGKEDLTKALSYLQKRRAMGFLGLDGGGAGDRILYSSFKTLRWLKAAELRDTVEAYIIVLIDTWRTPEELDHAIDQLRRLIADAPG